MIADVDSYDGTTWVNEPMNLAAKVNPYYGHTAAAIGPECVD